MTKVPRSSVLTAMARQVVRHGWAWLRDPEGRREEGAAASLAAFIMFLPLIIGAFGFGVDHARNIWIRTSIQNAVDSSAVAGAAVTNTNRSTGAVEIDPANAPIAIRKLYALNRADNPGLKCIGDRVHVAGTPHERCWKEPYPAVKVSPQLKSIEFNVREQSTNAFLGFLGNPIQTYNLQGKAKVSLSTE